MFFPVAFRPVKIALLTSLSLAFAPLALAEDMATKARVSGQAKNAAVKTITNFSQALRCMDELFLQFGKNGIVITSTGIPDETGKVRTGTKEMLITAISKMTVKSNAFDFIDLHSAQDDLSILFQMKGGGDTKVPDYYIRGSVTQMDDNAVRNNKGFGIALPFLDLGFSKDDAYDLLSMDMSIGDAATRRIIPETSTSNTLVLSKTGRSGEAGGKIGKAGLSFNLDISRSEGVGAASRTLIELGLIETLGKFTRVPYWKCLDAEPTNPMFMEQGREWFEMAKPKDRVLFIQRKLSGMNRYKGPLDGMENEALKTAVAEYQAQTGLIADGRINFDLYYSLLDDTQNQLAALPATPQKAAPVPGMSGNLAPPPQAAPAPAAPIAAPMLQAGGGALQVRLSSDRGAKPTYRIGEFLNMSMSLTAPGNVYCYYEDITRNTARIFPNRFHPDPMLKAGGVMSLPGSGYKIKFDKPGRERVACVGSDQELIVPPGMKGSRDLAPLPVRSLDDVIGQFRQSNPAATASFVDITVQP